MGRRIVSNARFPSRALPSVLPALARVRGAALMFGEFAYFILLWVIHELKFDERQQMVADDDGMRRGNS